MVGMDEVVSAIVQKNMPLKQKYPSAFTIPCVIGNASFKRALSDLGASISVMPKHVYDSLSLEPLNKTSIVIQLTDRSFVYPLGVIEDVLVKIDSLVIPCNFYILDMEHDSCDSLNNTPILFGRPFLKTANTKIDCGKEDVLVKIDRWIRLIFGYVIIVNVTYIVTGGIVNIKLRLRAVTGGTFLENHPSRQPCSSAVISSFHRWIGLDFGYVVHLDVI
jgi:hypothetical protein